MQVIGALAGLAQPRVDARERALRLGRGLLGLANGLLGLLRARRSARSSREGAGSAGVPSGALPPTASVRSTASKPVASRGRTRRPVMTAAAAPASITAALIVFSTSSRVAALTVTPRSPASATACFESAATSERR